MPMPRMVRSSSLCSKIQSRQFTTSSSSPLLDPEACSTMNELTSEAHPPEPNIPVETSSSVHILPPCPLLFYIGSTFRIAFPVLPLRVSKDTMVNSEDVPFQEGQATCLCTTKPAETHRSHSGGFCIVLLATCSFSIRIPVFALGIARTTIWFWRSCDRA